MKRIEYLPKWYDKSDLTVKQQEVEVAIKELLDSGKLTVSEREFLSDVNFKSVKGTYSRNYIITQVNELIKFVSYRKGE